MTQDTLDNENKSSSLCGIWWWATLVIAVLAVPAFGFLVTVLLPISDINPLVTFVLSCWLCIYLGMKLMKNPSSS